MSDERSSSEGSSEKGSIRNILSAFFPKKPLQWFGVALALGGVAALGGGVTAMTGLVNLSAIPPHPVGWAHLLHYGMVQSVAHHADASPPSDEPLESPAMVLRGATQYAVVCENCHGAPGFGQSPVALSLRPEPPMVVDATKQFSDKELFFIVENGVRYAGMPAWPVTNRPDEIWAMVAFLKQMPSMTRDTYLRLAHGDPAVFRRAEAAAATGGGMGESTLAEAAASSAASALSAFIPSKRERPYLPGDAQEAFASPGATLLPRTGFGPVGAGADPLGSCATCHGADGAGRPGGAFPNLTLQSPQYLYDALNAFATGQRQSGIMWPIAGNLTDSDMRALAVHFGGRAAVPTAPDFPAAKHDERGAEIASAGVGDNADNSGDAGAKANVGQTTLTSATLARPSGVAGAAVERCSSCHMPGKYIGTIIPRLDGQNAAYLRMQMHAFKRGGRGDTSTYDPMVADSHNLSDAEIASLADYYAALPPLAKIAKN